MVELSFADVFDDALHVRLDERADDAADECEDTHHREQLWPGPPAELVGLREHDGEDHEPGSDGQQRLDELQEEVDAVLQSRSSRRPEGTCRPGGARPPRGSSAATSSANRTEAAHRARPHQVQQTDAEQDPRHLHAEADEQIAIARSVP